VLELRGAPVVAWRVVSSLGRDQGLASGVAIFAAGCASTASPAFARMVGLDPELALIVSLITTALVPLTAPPIALWLMGIDLSISIAGFMARLLLVVGVPALLSLALRHAIGPARPARWGDAVAAIL